MTDGSETVRFMVDDPQNPLCVEVASTLNSKSLRCSLVRDRCRSEAIFNVFRLEANKLPEDEPRLVPCPMPFSDLFSSFFLD